MLGADVSVPEEDDEFTPNAASKQLCGHVIPQQPESQSALVQSTSLVEEPPDEVLVGGVTVEVPPEGKLYPLKKELNPLLNALS